MQIKETKVLGFPQVYRLVEIGIDGKEKPTYRFRVRKRIKVGGKWTTRLQTFDSFEEAKRFSRKKQEPSISKEGDETFSEVFERFLTHKRIKERLSEGTLDGYGNRSKHFRFFEELVMSHLSPKAVDAWLDLMFSPEYLEAQQKSRVSYEHEYFLLSGLFSYYRNHENEEFKVPLLKRHREIACRRQRANEEKEIRYLTSCEEEDFLFGLRSHPVIQDFALFQLHTGARVGEVAALEFRNIDFREREVRLAQHLYWERKKGSRIDVIPGTKGGPSRKVPLTSECRDMLSRRRQNGLSKVFEAPKGGWLTYRAIQSIYDRAFKKMELPHRGTHTLRHTFAVRFLESTKDIHALQRLLGHSDLKDTQIYAKYTNESVRRSFQYFRGGLAGNSEKDVPQLVPQH